MVIRKAELEDLNAISLLASAKRKKYSEYQLVFHREHPKAMESHVVFLKDVLEKGQAIILVNGTEKGINGFVIGMIVNAPPVYDPGGKICLVDDFMVEKPELWLTVGRELLEEVTRLAKEKGAVLVNVVCGPKDQAKREFLTTGNFEVASEWHVKPIN